MSTPSLLGAWLAQEKEVLARINAGVGVSRPEQVAGRAVWN